MDAIASTTDALTSMLVPLFLIVGIGLAVGTLFTNHNRKKKDDQINKLVNFDVPRELEKLPASDYVVLKRPLFLTLIGKSRCDYVIISTHGIYLLEFGRINGYVDGRENESGWKFPKLMGFSSQRFTSPLWRAKIIGFELRKIAAEQLSAAAEKLPCYPMAVFPAETRLCDALQEYDFVEDDDYDEDEYEYVDDDYEGDDVIESEEDEYDFIDDTRFVGHPSEVFDFITWHQGEALTIEQARALGKLIEKKSAEAEEAELPEKPEGYFPDEYREFTANYHTKEEIALNQARGEAARKARKEAKKQGLKGDELEAAVRAAALAVTMDDIKAKDASQKTEGE